MATKRQWRTAFQATMKVGDTVVIKRGGKRFVCKVTAVSKPPRVRRKVAAR